MRGSPGQTVINSSEKGAGQSIYSTRSGDRWKVTGAKVADGKWPVIGKGEGLHVGREKSAALRDSTNRRGPPVFELTF